MVRRQLLSARRAHALRLSHLELGREQRFLRAARLAEHFPAVPAVVPALDPVKLPATALARRRRGVGHPRRPGGSFRRALLFLERVPPFTPHVRVRLRLLTARLVPVADDGLALLVVPLGVVDGLPGPPFGGLFLPGLRPLLGRLLRPSLRSLTVATLATPVAGRCHVGWCVAGWRGAH